MMEIMLQITSKHMNKKFYNRLAEAKFEEEDERFLMQIQTKLTHISPALSLDRAWKNDDTLKLTSFLRIFLEGLHELTGWRHSQTIIKPTRFNNFNGNRNLS